jgi:hypothetical protein
MSIFQTKRFVQIHDNDTPVIFRAEFKRNDSGKYPISRIDLIFNRDQCTENNWKKLKKLCGTSGKYFHGYFDKGYKDFINDKFRFCIRKKYDRLFFNENTAVSTQREILTEFINEVVGRI